MKQPRKSRSKKSTTPVVVDQKSAAANDQTTATIPANDQPKPEVVLTKKAISARSEGVRLYVLAGRPSQADLKKVFGKDGGKLTWVARAEKVGLATAEEAAAQFQTLLAKAGK
jgi:hypothetical protein